MSLSAEGPFGAVEGNAPGAEMATMFTVPLLVMEMQNTVPSMAACGMPSVRLPAHMAVSLMHRVSRLAEGAGVCLARAEDPGRAGRARAAGGEGVQFHAQRAVEEPLALLGWAVGARVLGGGVTGGGVGGASSTGGSAKKAKSRSAT